jgi:acyl carrier protein
MTKTLWPVVRAAVAQRLGRGGASSLPRTNVDEGAELTSLDVVLVVLDVEDMEHTRLPIEDLAAVHTVGELLEVLCAPRGSASTAPDPDAEQSAVRDRVDHLTRHTLATYLGWDTDALTPDLRLREDLRMATVDIALVMLRLEDIAQAQFPQSGAQLVATVRDLVELYRAILRSRPGREGTGGGQLSARRVP